VREHPFVVSFSSGRRGSPCGCDSSEMRKFVRVEDPAVSGDQPVSDLHRIDESMAMLELMDTPSKRTPHQTSGQSWPSALSSRSVTETSCGWCTTSSDALAVDHVTLRWPIAQFTPYAALAPGSPADGRGTQPDRSWSIPDARLNTEGQSWQEWLPTTRPRCGICSDERSTRLSPDDGSTSSSTTCRRRKRPVEQGQANEVSRR